MVLLLSGWQVYENDAAWNTHLDMQSETPALAAEFAKYPDYLDGPVLIEYYGAVVAATKERFETNWASQPIAWHSPVLGFTSALPARGGGGTECRTDFGLSDL